jgi:hypothetical protein
MKLVCCCSVLLGISYLACTVVAQADPATLNVPILMRGSFGEDACPQRSRVIGTETDIVAVQGGPNTGFREVGQVHGGDVLFVCEQLGPWLGVVYGPERLGCRTTVLVPMQTEYAGPCERGWVQADKVSDEPSSPISNKQPDDHKSAHQE